MIRSYAFPVLLGLLCIRTLAGFAAWVRRDLNLRIQQSLRSAQVEGRLSPELQNAEIGTIPPSEFGMEMSRSLLFRVQLADFIVSFWFIWAPLIMIGCLGTAAFFRKH